VQKVMLLYLYYGHITFLHSTIQKVIVIISKFISQDTVECTAKLCYIPNPWLKYQDDVYMSIKVTIYDVIKWHHDNVITTYIVSDEIQLSNRRECDPWTQFSDQQLYPILIRMLYCYLRFLDDNNITNIDEGVFDPTINIFTL
jgi:hypothetical protein